MQYIIFSRYETDQNDGEDMYWGENGWGDITEATVIDTPDFTLVSKDAVAVRVYTVQDMIDAEIELVPSLCTRCGKAGEVVMNWAVGDGFCQLCGKWQAGIEPGDIVTVKSQGLTLTGKASSAINYGSNKHHNWYIEFNVNNIYHYWKQDIDGGTVERMTE